MTILARFMQMFAHKSDSATAESTIEGPFGIWKRGQTDAFQMPDAVLFSRIAQAVSWCNRQANAPGTAMQFRDPKLAPDVLHDGIDDAIFMVGMSRNQRLRESTPTAAVFPDLAGGRLLLYFPHENLACGSAELESEGFYDVNNTPPWDTWVACFEDATPSYHAAGTYVLCYVPPHWEGLADLGIEVNPEECINWLGKRDVALARRLQKYL